MLLNYLISYTIIYSIKILFMTLTSLISLIIESDIIKEKLNTSSNKYEKDGNKNIDDKTHENNETQNENKNLKI